MAVRKSRRNSKSLVVTIPVEKAAKAHVVAGERRILPIRPQRRPDFLAIGQQVIREERTLLDRLAN